jgi:hypothetical protein
VESYKKISRYASSRITMVTKSDAKYPFFVG